MPIKLLLINTNALLDLRIMIKVFQSVYKGLTRFCSLLKGGHFPAVRTIKVYLSQSSDRLTEHITDTVFRTAKLLLENLMEQ